MQLIVEQIRFKNTDLGETNTTDWPVDNLADVVDVEIDFRYDGDYLLATSVTPNDGDTVIIGNPGSNLTGLIRDQNVLWTDDPFGFENFDEGDELTIKQSGQPDIVLNVTEKVSNTHLLTDYSFGVSAVIYPVNSVVYVSTKLEAIEFKHGWVANSEPVNTISKTDGSDQRAIVEGLDNNDTVTVNSMTQLGDKSYQYGTLSVTGNGTGDGASSPAVSQAFTISHRTLVSPLFLADQINNDINGIAPEYFLNSDCLRYVFEISTSKDLTDPNRQKTIVSGDKLGNTGWLDENFNSGITNYSVSNVVYKRADSTVINALELTTDEQTVEFDLENTTDSPFDDSLTKFVLNHWFMPLPEDEYRLPAFPDPSQTYLSRNRTLKENFLFDRIVCTLGALSTTPDNLGGADQVIKQCNSTFTSTSKIHVTATVAFSAEAVERLGVFSQANYKLSISTKEHTLTRSKSDKATLTIDTNKYFTDQTDPAMVETTITYLDHPNSDVDAGETVITARTEDDILAVASFTLDRNDITGFKRAGTEVRLTSATAQVIARKNSTTYFVLDGFTAPLQPTVINNATYGNIPYVDITENRGFTTPADSLRQNIRLKRRNDLDSSGKFAYEFRFPFIYRWENWEKLEGVNDEFVDLNLPVSQHLGRNQDWSRYVVGTGWNMFFRTVITATKDGVQLAPYITETQILTEDYDDGTEWDTPVGNAYLASSGDQIANSGQMGVSLSENTRLDLDMNFNTTPTPALSELEMVMRIAVFEKSGYKGQYRISSVYAATADNVFTGLTGNLVTKTNPSGTNYRASAIVKGGQLEDAQTYRVSWRFYDTRADFGVPNGLMTETSVLISSEQDINVRVE